MSEYQCRKCKRELTASEAYEYRGAISCAEHFDEVELDRNFERQEIINEENAKTEMFRGLDLSPDTPVGRANREILAPQIEIASKESARMREYEKPTQTGGDEK